MFVFKLPEIGEGVIEGEVVRWLVQVGEIVAADQPVAEIMTDKATVEISTPAGGRVAALHAAEGDVVPVHAPLLEIDTGAEAPAPSPEPPPSPEPAAERKRPRAAPAVRRRARELGVDLGSVQPSGPGGRVTHQDLEGFAEAPPAPAAPTPAAPEPSAPGADEVVRVVGLRRRIAEQMVRSRFTAPHFTYVDEMDATELWALKDELAPLAARRGVHLTFLPFVMKALSLVFRDFPDLNANVVEEPLSLVRRRQVNIGIATDTERGLYVPVVHDVQRKPIIRIAQELGGLVERTRAGQVGLEELRGGTFTITSVGNIGGLFATPIINHPEVAILGLNRVHERPVVRDGQVVVRRMMYLSPSFDHRVIDGAVGARFTTALKAILERPRSMLLELA